LAKSEEFRSALLLEMIARCVKKEFEAILRSEMRTLGFPGEVFHCINRIGFLSRLMLFEGALPFGREESLQLGTGISKIQYRIQCILE
jgi:hypothetical protein